MGLSKRAMREAGITAQERDYYNRKPVTGAYDFLMEDESVHVNRTAKGGIVLGTGEKARAFGEWLKVKQGGGTIVEEDSNIVFYDEVICQMEQTMANEIIAEAFWLA